MRRWPRVQWAERQSPIRIFPCGRDPVLFTFSWRLAGLALDGAVLAAMTLRIESCMGARLRMARSFVVNSGAALGERTYSDFA